MKIYIIIILFLFGAMILINGLKIGLLVIGISSTVGIAIGLLSAIIRKYFDE